MNPLDIKEIHMNPGNQRASAANIKEMADQIQFPLPDILVKKNQAQGLPDRFSVVNGNMRMRALLQMNGTVKVREAGTNKVLTLRLDGEGNLVIA
jgi:hypothetical protein